MTAVKHRRRENDQEAASGASVELSPPVPFFPDPALICVALEAGRIGIWSWDIRSGQATWSTNIEEICDLTKGTLDGTKMVLDHDVHPEDRPAVIAAMQEALRTRTPRRVQYRLAPEARAAERWIEKMAPVGTEGAEPTKLLRTSRAGSHPATKHHQRCRPARPPE